MKLLNLAKSYDFTTETEYWDYCIDSLLNGNYDQSEKLFNAMSKMDRKCFLLYVNDTVMLPADKRNIYNFYFNLL